MGFTLTQMVEMLEEEMDYEDFRVLEEIIEKLFWTEDATDRKKIIEKLKVVLHS